MPETNLLTQKKNIIAHLKEPMGMNEKRKARKGKIEKDEKIRFAPV